MSERKLSHCIRLATPLIWPFRLCGEVIQYEMASWVDQVNHHVGDRRVFGEVLDVATINEDEIERCQPGKAVLPAICNHSHPTICAQKVQSRSSPLVVDFNRYQGRR